MDNHATAMKGDGAAPTPELAEFIDPFPRLALELPGRRAAAGIEIEETEGRMRALGRQGIVQPSRHRRTSSRDARYLALVSPDDACERRSGKYTGIDPATVREAPDALDRGGRVFRLNERLHRLTAALFAGACDVFTASRTLAPVLQ